MRQRAAVGSFLALVTGCGQAPTVPAPKAVQPPAQHVERYSAQFEWLGGVQGNRAGLDFAIPETDAVGVTLECDRGSRMVRTASVDPRRQGTHLLFGSGQTRAELTTTPSHDTDFDDSYWAVAMVATDRPVFSAFKASGTLWVWDADEPMSAETDAEREAIANFFRFCDEH